MTECELFMAALDFDSPDERRAYLEQACGGDPVMRERVERLLDSHAKAGSLLEHPAVEVAATLMLSDTDAVSRPGDYGSHLDAEGETVEFLQASEQLDSLGRLEHYEIGEVIGRGGMGIVFRAFDTKLLREVAIKVIAGRLAEYTEARERFIREAQAAAAVRDDHVVSIYAVQDAAVRLYLVMELVVGTSLQQRLDAAGPLGIAEILRIGIQIAQGLAAAHARGLIHFDIKPANILLEDGSGRVKLTDFGLARAVDGPRLTQSGVIAGTPHFMSPEQAQDHTVDQRTDLFSFGSVLYAMCAGRPPFLADTTQGTLNRVCEQMASSLRAENPDVPEWLAAMIDKLLAKDPSERYQSAAEVAQVLGGQLALMEQPPLLAASTLPTAEDRFDPCSMASVVANPGSKSFGRRAGAMTALLLGLFGFGLTEATGLTRTVSTVVGVVSGEGTLLVQNAEPEAKVTVELNGLLVIDRSELRRFRLRPGNYQVHVEQNGKRIPLERDVVMISRGGDATARVRVEKELSTFRTPSKGIVPKLTESGMFEVVDRNGRRRKFGSLHDAVTASYSGDTIEIRGDGPFPTQPVFISHALTIQAAPGFRPVLVLAPQHDDSNPILLAADAPLVLEGLELCSTVRVSTHRPQAVLQSLASLSMANCRLLALHGDGAWCAGDVVIRNCEFLAPDPGLVSVVSWNLRGNNRCVIENCVMIGRIFIPWAAGDLKPNRAYIQLHRNTVVAIRAIQISVTALPSSLTADMSEAAVRFDVSRNVFACRRQIVVFDQLALPQPLTSADAEILLRNILAWNDEQNLYSAGSNVLTLCADMQPLAPPKDLAQWSRFWGFSPSGTLQDAIVFQGGDLFARATSEAEQFSPPDFRLVQDSPGFRAGPDGASLGADIDLVGPGPAYQRWRSTPEYQHWLQETRH